MAARKKPPAKAQVTAPVKKAKAKAPSAPVPAVKSDQERLAAQMEEVSKFYGSHAFTGTRFITPEMMLQFLICLSTCANITKSARLVGCYREQLYSLRIIEPEFNAAWEKALKIGNEALEDEATRRGFDGVDKPVFYQGLAVAMVKEYSDNLLQFVLKTKDPDRYKDRTTTELTGPAAGPIQNVNFNTEDPNEAAQIYQQMMGTGAKKK